MFTLSCKVLTWGNLYGIMEVEKVKKRTKELQELTAKLGTGFSYSEQELIRRVFKAVISQMKNKTDIGVAQDILERTKWLDNGL